MYPGGESKKKQNPKEKANLLSLITFFFTWDLLKKGYKKDIVEDDIYEVMRKFRASKLGDDLEKKWKEQQSTRNPSVYRMLWSSYGKYYLLLGLVQLVSKIIMVMVHPRALGKLVSYFTDNSKLTKTDAIYYAIVVVGLNIINCTYAHNYQLWITELGIRIKTAFCSLIYRKSLKLTSSNMSEIGVGKIVTLISKDVMNFEIAIIFLNDMWISLVILVITSALMYSRVGVAALAGVLFMVLIIPLQVLFGKLTSSLRIRASKVTDHRLQVTQETLSAIKIIKMYTWENFFGQKISKARKEEMSKIRQIYWTKATSLVIGGLVINLTLYIIVMTYIHLGHNFTAEVAFFLWGCLHSLRSTVTISIPIGIAQTAELSASVRRIFKVLTAKEQPENGRDRASEPSIKLKDVAVTINNSRILHNIDLDIGSGLNFVTGRLGGGKSSLLKTILEDYQISEGKLKIEGTVSYASEEPWLFPSSIKQNILFGKNFNEERYKRVLSVCALEMDLGTFEKGDETIVDDRGMNLSKGQQARISLARAVYCDSDIYLLDDCLSALDTQVQDYVFKHCVKNFLKDKIVVMISHNERQLKEADNIIHMENGTVKSCMKPSEIPEDEIEELVREEDKIVEADIIDNIVLEDEDEVKEETQLLPQKPHQNIYHEKKKEGKVELNVYGSYFKFGGGFLVMVPVFALFIAAQAGSSYSDKLVSNWVNIQQNISEHKFGSTNSTNYEALLKRNDQVLNTYSFVVVVATVLLLSRAYAHFSFAGRASVALHKAMSMTVVNATMKFFDLQYLGNILNRFSKDLATIDEILPLNVYECLRLICTLTGILILVISVNVTFLIPAVIVLVFLLALRHIYLPTGRSLKRLDSATRSPVIGHLNASLDGLATIRAYNTQQILRKEFDMHQDLYTSAFFMMQCASRTFAYTLDMLCNFFVAAVVIRFLVVRKDTQAGNVGLAITQALQLTGLLQWSVRQWAELENQMTSVERVVEYTNVEREKKSGQVVENWPSEGKITYSSVNLTYGKSKEFILKNINFSIQPREKIGIVGRTGAGKSSLISVLFRLYQFDGSITIDGIDIKTLSLEFLRSNIAIIPQDPMLFTGTIRSNIDPTGRYRDDEIWKAITTAKLKDLIPSLDFLITENGANFSAGQKQLICLARAIISKSKIIILDEATANVDPETDVMIYTTIQESFVHCTVLTIVHRLHTVLYSDKVMVVDKGEIVEFDNPITLLDNTNGVFYKMIDQANLLK